MLGPATVASAGMAEIGEVCSECVGSELLGSVRNEVVAVGFAEAATSQAYECLRRHPGELSPEARKLVAVVAAGRGVSQPRRLEESFEVVRELVPARSPKDWTDLAKSKNPETEGKSAACAASTWHGANGGIPPRVREALSEADEDALNRLDCLLVVPEIETPLPPHRQHGPSCTDVFVLGRSAIPRSDGRQLVAIGVEAKVLESFGESMSTWLEGDTADTRFHRAAHVLGLLGIPLMDGVEELPWQLFHRTAATVIEAYRFCASHAAMLVHSFDPADHGKREFDTFCSLFDIAVGVDKVRRAREIGGIQLHLGWVRDEPPPPLAMPA